MDSKLAVEKNPREWDPSASMPAESFRARVRSDVLYRDWHVPFALSTDDAGVFRIDLTNEYLRFVRDYDASYAELREADRNSLTYSFLPGDSLWDNKSCVEDVAKAAGASADCQGLLDRSEKARMQWKLEERLQAFERHVADGSENPETG